MSDWADVEAREWLVKWVKHDVLEDDLSVQLLAALLRRVREEDAKWIEKRLSAFVAEAFMRETAIRKGER